MTGNLEFYTPLNYGSRDLLWTGVEGLETVSSLLVLLGLHTCLVSRGSIWGKEIWGKGL